MERDTIPLVDIGPLLTDAESCRATAAAIGRACREDGFFYVVGHGVEDALVRRLEDASRRFFARDLDDKLAIRMALGGRAWRGYFPVGHELTLGRPDHKEGLYFGAELHHDHPAVAAGTPLHGPNLFPATIPELRPAVLDYMAAMVRLGHALAAGLALGLGLAPSYFAERYTADPLILFRVFNYPPLAAPTSGSEPAWSVAEHTDYGLLTILWQDACGGLEVRSRGRWLEAPPVPGSFVCNIGDMLERMTGGRYRSTPHRVRNRSGRARLAFAFFFDPAFDAEVRPIAPPPAADGDDPPRWDGVDVHDLTGTYGDYLLGKVARVFPELGREVL